MATDLTLWVVPKPVANYLLPVVSRDGGGLLLKVVFTSPRFCFMLFFFPVLVDFVAVAVRLGLLFLCSTFHGAVRSV